MNDENILQTIFVLLVFRKFATLTPADELVLQSFL